MSLCEEIRDSFKERIEEYRLRGRNNTEVMVEGQRYYESIGRKISVG